MDEQTRGTEMPRSTLRKFMNDPKSSVMSYLAENMAAQQIQQHVQPQNHGPNVSQQNNPPYRQQYQNQSSSSLSNQFQNHNNTSQTSLAPSQTTQTGGAFSSASSQPGQAQSSQISSLAPYLASNVGGPLNQAFDGHSSEGNNNEKLPQQNLAQQQIGSNQPSGFSMKSLGKPPPTPGMKHNSSPQSAPRLYHRMNLDFEVTKNTFFTARAQHNSQEMTSAAYDLESLSRRIWSLRFEHAWEFEGYEETGHQAVISHWQTQYELWADTVLDIQEGDSAASMFAVHRTSSSAATALGSNSSTNPVTSQLGGNNLSGSYNQPQQSSYQEMDVNVANQMSAQSQQVFANQNPLMDQRMPSSQSAQMSPPPQYPPHTNVPGALPLSSPPPATGNLTQQSFPLQQQSMTPPPQQGGLVQNGPIQAQNRPQSSTQNGQPGMGVGPSNGQNMPQNIQPLAQRGPFQQNSPQQTGQQIQSGPPQNAPQAPFAPYTAQRPPSRPNSTNMPPQGPMSQMSLGQGQPSRPDLYPQQGPQ